VTPFRFEQQFRAPSIAALLRAYFDPDLQATQDVAAKIRAREVLELDDGAERRIAVVKVFPERQVPAILRPLISGPLHYVERSTWDKRTNRIELDIRPSIMTNRTQIRMTYVPTLIAPGLIERVIEGEATADIALIGGRVEKIIVEDMGRSLPVVSACTQVWLDAHAADRP
jgi:hypothetical protein